MSEIKFVEGGISVDVRGQISHVNDLDMSEIKRFYVIHQKDTSIIGHGMLIRKRKNGFMW